jgi:hypothetical protein
VPPLASQLEDLAAALGFHVADLYVIADVPVPEALTHWDPAAGSGIVHLVQTTMALQPDRRTAVHRMVDQLPRELRDGQSDPPRTYDQQNAGFGAMLANLLCGNRNLHSLTAAAKALGLLTDGRVYLAASTISGIGRGRVPLTPDLVAGFAITLGISVGDLAAITGVEMPEPPWPDDLLADEMAGLLWKCRRLTATQVGRVHDEAKSMLVELPDDATEEDWKRVYHHHGRWWGAPRR